MSEQPFNPYQSSSESPNLPTGDNKVARASAELARWQTFFAVLMSIAVVGVILLFSLSAMSGTSNIGGLFCIVGTSLLMYGLPALMLWKAAAGARKYSRSPGPGELANFTSSQLSFWRTVGILAAIIIGLYAIILVGALLFGFSAALNQA